MTIWVFVAAISWGGVKIDAAPNMTYAFLKKESCEYAIAGSTILRCIELKVIE